jgi:acyl-coenzyme A thioesterase PaaI-like protein
MTMKSFQDYYPEDVAHCYGCGRLNEHGLHIRSFWDGDDTVAVVDPKPWHVAVPGYVYGGLIASLIDCHCIGTAAAARHRADGLDPDVAPLPRFVTASLHVEYHRPTPLGVPLEVRGRVEELGERKVVVSATLSASGETCASGRVVAVRMPEHMSLRADV